ncbi:MAG: ATP-binding protein [Candidatus Omnitrophota bacterium]
MKNFTKTGFYISSKIGKAIQNYKLINNGDRILIGISGGKDSLSLLSLLKERQRWAPVKFELAACHILADFDKNNQKHRQIIDKLCKKLGIKCYFKKIKVLDKNKKTNCFWCSWNRRKELFLLAGKLGFNKIMLGHHMDDIIETTLLNLFFNGEISTMNPCQKLFNGQLTVIRPLCYVEECKMQQFAKENKLPIINCNCPIKEESSRKHIKNLIKNLQKKCPAVKMNIFKSITRIRKDYLDIKI